MALKNIMTREGSRIMMTISRIEIQWSLRASYKHANWPSANPLLAQLLIKTAKSFLSTLHSWILKDM
jgi:hypothetical protein